MADNNKLTETLTAIIQALIEDSDLFQYVLQQQCRIEVLLSQGIYKDQDTCLGRRAVCYVIGKDGEPKRFVLPHNLCEAFNLTDPEFQEPQIWGVCKRDPTRTCKMEGTAFLLCYKIGEKGCYPAAVIYWKNSITSIVTGFDVIERAMNEVKGSTPKAQKEAVKKALCKLRREEVQAPTEKRPRTEEVSHSSSSSLPSITEEHLSWLSRIGEPFTKKADDGTEVHGVFIPLSSIQSASSTMNVPIPERSTTDTPVSEGDVFKPSDALNPSNSIIAINPTPICALPVDTINTIVSSDGRENNDVYTTDFFGKSSMPTATDVNAGYESFINATSSPRIVDIPSSPFSPNVWQ